MSSTPVLADVLRAAIKDALSNVNVSLPGIVEKYDASTNSADCKPSIKNQFGLEMPIINAVPVVFPRGGNFKMKWDLKKNDPVTLIFSQRSLDIWKASGGVVDPQDPRMFHLSDAIAIPGGSSFPEKLDFSTSDRTILISGSAKVELIDAGKFKITNGTEEFLDLMSQTLAKLITLTDKLNTDTVNTMLGPMKLNFFADYGTLKSDLTTLKSKLDSIKG